ncbi:MAG: YfeK family protein [Klebsiella huaxiensis]|uniref:YfeK family protein n=1 Tax=Klebsiella TaxID=570 RepID=UPI0026EE97D8|nr:YfeK family protein [Klebsiella huaxiensis]WEJ86785.1 MAG: YfeK family protein [Klebsiella huaxiensis]
MKNILCAVMALFLTLPAFAKLNAYQEARINAMLDALGQKKDLIFVRNGDAHTCEEAVSHLRLKLGNTRNRIDTAEQFIDKVASSSSITGKPYIVRIPGKSDENAQPYLHTLIAETDKTVTVENQ